MVEVKFSIAVIVFQTALIVLFGVLVDYGDYALPPHKRNGANGSYSKTLVDESKNDISVFYSLFQDVHVMIYIGFGFLMTFLRKYGYSAVGYNFFIAALVCQWATILSGVFNQIIGEGAKSIRIDVKTLISAEFTAGAVLITFGAVLGKVSRLQLLVIGFFEVFFYAINEYLNVHYLKIADAGGSMIIHAFGAYFGLAVARIIYRTIHSCNGKEESVYHSDMFAMIGTLFLWMFWPSFNGILVAPDYIAQHRAVINTYYSLAASCVVTFAISPFFQKGNKLNMVHIQNATLAGGVAMGTVCNMVLYPFGAVIVGSLAGVISTLGYAYLTAFFDNHLNIHDTCGVNNLHGMPGIIGGIVGAITTANANEDTYGYKGLFNIWGAMAPKANSTEFARLQSLGIPDLEPGDGYTANQMAGYQVAAIFVTLGVSLIGGVITGFVAKLGIFDPPEENQLFDDEDFWELPNASQLPQFQGQIDQESGHSINSIKSD
ncbi:ammonium transporter Rh type A isoform X1 [Exaiptasia diaphana]|uniref:Ammonium transporter AmtB-like domain-containing protein n=1 Tax=Exaiptasia diaphana TaxID=2652724 RepID=A0A913WSJ0_EXADI|nr:ammonium transporter Rh type A isoform X1 [Exaiptasia diaphana]